MYIYLYYSVLGRECKPTPVFLPGEFHTQRSLVVYTPWRCKELDKTEATNTFIFFQATLRRRSPRKCVGREEPRENQCFGAQVKSCKRDWKGVIHMAKVILASTETKRWKSVSRRRELSTELNADMRSSSTKRVLLGNMEKESVTVIEPSRGMVGLNWVLLCWGYIRMDWKVHGNE